MKLPEAPTFSLANKNALVVGASSVIGLACAVALADYGANVTLAARRTKNIKELAEKYRSELIESAVEQDDDVMEQYLDGNEPDTETVKRCIRKGVLNQSFVPVLNGTAFKNKGVQPLLDAVVDFMPSPIDVEAIKGINPDTEDEMKRESSDEEPLSLLAFKVMNDPFVGNLTFARIYSGVLETGQTLVNTVKNKKERIGRMLEMHSNTREDIKEARAGDIVALVGLKAVSYTHLTLPTKRIV